MVDWEQQFLSNTSGPMRKLCKSVDILKMSEITLVWVFVSLSYRRLGKAASQTHSHVAVMILFTPHMSLTSRPLISQHPRLIAYALICILMYNMQWWKENLWNRIRHGRWEAFIPSKDSCSHWYQTDLTISGWLRTVHKWIRVIKMDG